MYRNVLIDITGGCNAKCPLCVTGREDFGKRIHFMPVDQFARTVDRIIELDLLDRSHGFIGLHNWGEPILHPDLNGIVAELNKRTLPIVISTNGSKKTNFTVSTAGFSTITFSVPGWSQESQDRIHGLNFERVVANIKASIDNIRANGYRGKFFLAYHIYQFNGGAELKAARTWCAQNDLEFHPYYAYINDYKRAKAFLNGTMADKEKQEISETIYLDYLERLLAAQPKNYKCPQWDHHLTLNHKSEVVVCCGLPYSMQETYVGSIFDLDRDEIIKGKTTSKECDDCISCGNAYWGHHPKMAVSAMAPRVAARQFVMAQKHKLKQLLRL